MIVFGDYSSNKGDDLPERKDSINLNTPWSVLMEITDLAGDHVYPAMDKAAEELSLPPDYFTFVSAIWLFGLEPFTTAQFMRVFPYGLGQVNEEIPPEFERFLFRREFGLPIDLRSCTGFHNQEHQGIA